MFQNIFDIVVVQSVVLVVLVTYKLHQFEWKRLISRNNFANEYQKNYIEIVIQIHDDFVLVLFLHIHLK